MNKVLYKESYKGLPPHSLGSRLVLFWNLRNKDELPHNLNMYLHAVDIFLKTLLYKKNSYIDVVPFCLSKYVQI